MVFSFKWIPNANIPKWELLLRMNNSLTDLLIKHIAVSHETYRATCADINEGVIPDLFTNKTVHICKQRSYRTMREWVLLFERPSYMYEESILGLSSMIHTIYLALSRLFVVFCAVSVKFAFILLSLLNEPRTTATSFFSLLRVYRPLIVITGLKLVAFPWSSKRCLVSPAVIAESIVRSKTSVGNNCMLAAVASWTNVKQQTTHFYCYVVEIIMISGLQWSELIYLAQWHCPFSTIGSCLLAQFKGQTNRIDTTSVGDTSVAWPKSYPWSYIYGIILGLGSC